MAINFRELTFSARSTTMLSVGAAQDALQIARVRIEGETVTIRGEQLEELLAGFDLWCQGHRELLMRRVG